MNRNDEGRSAPPHTASVQSYARMAGALFLISMVAGFFGEVYAPSKLLVSGDAAATVHNVTTLDSLFRLGFASYLVEAVCDVALALLLYVLLRPVQKHVALLAAFFGLVSTATYGIAEVFYFAPSVILSGADYLKSFSSDQLSALTVLSFKLYGRVGGIFMVFYGIAGVLRGYLIVRSGYLPRTLGVLLGLAGIGFIAKNFALVLAPTYASDVLLLPMFLAGVSLTAWLLVKGVDVPKWNAKTAASLPTVG